jgi:hypothetical protein
MGERRHFAGLGIGPEERSPGGTREPAYSPARAQPTSQLPAMMISDHRAALIKVINMIA